MTALVMDLPDVVCIACGHPIPVGSSYSWHPVAVGPGGEDEVLVEVVCPTGFCRAAS